MAIETTRCLVTGGAGFIGSHLVERLVQDGASRPRCLMTSLPTHLPMSMTPRLWWKATYRTPTTCSTFLRTPPHRGA
jgi:hypothetical protein